ncbi:hypothetical protein ACERK3_05325 [Phycisphaerales bacterium AB-hyl4]|uniref:Anti-sigma-28 factor FlgM C-terminal domain-containing protein n=1 Tax=Natronomicrosphaera hydrolytica TaxID=3242702 RepID=A0ABV4U608_9BACT
MICSKNKARVTSIRPTCRTPTPAQATHPPNDDAEHPSAEAPVRSDVVAKVKRQLQLGTYDEESKIDAILDRLIADVVAADDPPRSTPPQDAPSSDRQLDNAERSSLNRAGG